MKKKYIVFCCLVVIIISFLPLLFTRPAFCSFFDFSETGQIGDTIGGIMSPFIGLFSAILLYFTLQEQIAYNKQQKTDNSLTLFLTFQNELLQMDRRLSFCYCSRGETKTADGLFSLNFLRSGNNYAPQIQLAEANTLLDQLDVFLSFCVLYEKLLAENQGLFESYSCNNIVAKYKKIIKGVLLDLLYRDNMVIGYPQDVYSDDDSLSEIDKMRDRAEEIMICYLS